MSAQQECKYSRGELHFMAVTALRAKEEGDWRWFHLCLALMMATGMDADAVEDGIRRLAACPETN